MQAGDSIHLPRTIDWNLLEDDSEEEGGPGGLHDADPQVLDPSGHAEAGRPVQPSAAFRCVLMRL